MSCEEQISQATDAIKEGVGNFASGAMNQAEDVVDHVAEQAKEKISDTVEDAAEGLKNLFGSDK